MMEENTNSQPTAKAIQDQFTDSHQDGAEASRAEIEAERLEVDEDIFITTAEEFVDLQLEDFSWKVRARKSYGWVLVGLLIAQNIAVFLMVAAALILGKIGDLQLIFSVLVTATLGETAFMVKVIVEWLFRDINYPEV